MAEPSGYSLQIAVALGAPPYPHIPAAIPTPRFRWPFVAGRLELELDLSDAINTEIYEDAARCRDEINQVKQTVAPKPAS